MRPRVVPHTEAWEQSCQCRGKGGQAEDQPFRFNNSNFSCRNVCNKYHIVIKSDNYRCHLWWVRLLLEFSFPAVAVLLYIHPFICLFTVFIDQTFEACGVPGRPCSTQVTGNQVTFLSTCNFQKIEALPVFSSKQESTSRCGFFLVLVNGLYVLAQLQIYRKLSRSYPEFPHTALFPTHNFPYF